MNSLANIKTLKSIMCFDVITLKYKKRTWLEWLLNG